MAVFIKEFGYRMDQFEVSCDLMAVPLDPSEMPKTENQAQGKGEAPGQNKVESTPAPQARRRPLTWAEKKQLALAGRI